MEQSGKARALLRKHEGMLVVEACNKAFESLPFGRVFFRRVREALADSRRAGTQAAFRHALRDRGCKRELFVTVGAVEEAGARVIHACVTIVEAPA